jgi:hypothetical protein
LSFHTRHKPSNDGYSFYKQGKEQSMGDKGGKKDKEKGKKQINKKHEKQVKKAQDKQTKKTP